MWNCCVTFVTFFLFITKHGGHLRHNGVGGHDVLHLLGPGVHKAEPSAPQRDEGAVFDLEFVTVGVNLLSHLQHCGHRKHIVGTTQAENIIIVFSLLFILAWCSHSARFYLVCDTLPNDRCHPGENTRRRKFPAALGADSLR